MGSPGRGRCTWLGLLFTIHPHLCLAPRPAPRTTNHYPLLELLYPQSQPQSQPQQNQQEQEEQLRPPKRCAPPRRQRVRRPSASVSSSDSSIPGPTLRERSERGKWSVTTSGASVTLTAQTPGGATVTLTLCL
ncbi:early protein E4 [Alphapapillomavirus 4]|uniref:E4 protein n=1 Tax=Human papillomavirus type 2 TaxID=333751 RepID=A3F909_9PAPI|nr:early protein E4 [Alphapapillomavirus 4]ABN49463.1 early protein E4 [Human papillomavirus type 2]ABO14924.1 E4 protein [Human papillomavirus type 2]